MVAAGKSGSGLLCDETTQEASVAKLNFKKLDPIRVKGKEHPIQIFIPQEKDDAEIVLEKVLAEAEPTIGTEVRSRLNCIGCCSVAVHAFDT